MEAAANADHFGKLFGLMWSPSGKRNPVEPLLRNSFGGIVTDVSGKIVEGCSKLRRMV